MASYYKGRSSSSRSTYGAAWTGSSQGAWGRSSSYKRSASKTRKTGTTNTAQYRTVGSTFAKKIDSYKMLYAQTQGAAGKWDRPTPTTLNTMANWISKGAVIHNVSPTLIARWARACDVRFDTRNPSLTACKNVLWAKYNKNVIKAVALSKNGTFMVATSPTWNGRAFSFPR